MVFVGGNFESYYDGKKGYSLISSLEIGSKDIYLWGLPKVPILGNVL